MLILLPILLLIVTALTLVILRLARPNFKYNWLIAGGGAILALIAVLLWQLRLPQTLALPAWQLQAFFHYSPTWLADSVSWPYALSLTVLALAIVLTSVVRANVNPMTWAGMFMLTALGLLAVTAENPLTLVLAWTAIDLMELVSMLLSVESEEQSEGVVVAFAARLAGTGLVIWASILSVSSGTLLSFSNFPDRAGIYLLLAAGLRLGVLPLHLPYRHENTLRRGFGSSLRLVSAASSLVLLARIPASAVNASLTPFLLTLAALAALYAGWMWIRASDELTGRPYWLLGMASLAVAASLRANPTGSIAWGIALLLGGGYLFLNSARQRSLIWLSLFALWGLTALPFSLTASGWSSGTQISAFFWILFLPAQALLLAGFFRHSSNVGETSLESQLPWVKVIYLLGLLLLPLSQVLLGLWGWDGARQVGVWWAALTALALSAGLAWLSTKVLTRLTRPGATSRWDDVLRLDWLYRAAWGMYRSLGQVSQIITSTLEGDGGLIWSFIILLLALSLLIPGIR
ncbi:MAG: hypothetical protein KJ606_06645 [Chloroflexi bacterium]|nr:hypothetical protein [Chloroflexota bacterium]